MRTALILAAVALTLRACSTAVEAVRGPELAPIGYPAALVPTSQAYLPSPEQQHADRAASANSLWRAGARTFFGDQRARRIGDIVTVNIDIDDRAQTQNSTARSRTNEISNRLSRSGNVIAVLPGVPDDEVSSKFRFLIACDEGRQHEFRNYSALAPGSPKQDTNFHAEVSEHVARIVNDSGKIVRFRAILGDVMIGDHVKRAFEILMHLTSNAVDHGIDRFGSIELAVPRSGSGVYLSVADDGSGLKSDPEDGLKLFEPGFSTLSVSRRNSGRGYGLNIVKTEVEAVNGKISISSRKDLGTRFEIVLP